jgi:hypothetical protein
LIVMTIRNMGGVALFLAGTTWMWLTPAFASRGVSTFGAMWAVTRVLCVITVVGFCVATWGLFTQHGWWEPVASISAALGLLALIPYWLAATQGGESTGTTIWNTCVHVLMAGGIFVLLMVPQLERWVDHEVMGG